MKKEKLYPITYNGKRYYEEDCDEVFVCFYNDRYALNHLGGVYMSEGIWVYPDGQLDEF
jgi:hypothetical protein